MRLMCSTLEFLYLAGNGLFLGAVHVFGATLLVDLCKLVPQLQPTNPHRTGKASFLYGRGANSGQGIAHGDLSNREVLRVTGMWLSAG